MANILTIEQVRKAIYQDDDFDASELERLSEVASSFLKQKTGYDFADIGEGEDIEPLAIQAATMYVKQLYFHGQDYDKNYDFTYGLTGILIDLEILANEKIEEAA